jgi:hypothetical protein
MLLASDALSKFDGSTGLPTPPAQQQSPPAQQQPSAEAHPPRPVQPHRLLSLPLWSFHPSRPLLRSLPSFPLRSRERKRLRLTPLKRRRKSGRRSLRPRRRLPTSTPPRPKLNSLKPSITLSRLMIIPITPPRNGSSTNPSSPPLPAVSGRR